MATVHENRDSEHLDEHVAPPFLRRVRIRDYKSIAFCDVQLYPLTVLVGRNGAGKSNFLDALAFLRDAVQFNLPEAIKLRNGMQAIRCRSVPSEVIAIEIEVGCTLPPGEFVARYGFAIPA